MVRRNLAFSNQRSAISLRRSGGGLLSEDKSTQVTKVPLLSSIPVLGRLFEHHSIVATKHDVVIEVTPRILPEQQ